MVSRWVSQPFWLEQPQSVLIMCSAPAQEWLMEIKPLVCDAVSRGVWTPIFHHSFFWLYAQFFVGLVNTCAHRKWWPQEMKHMKPTPKQQVQLQLKEKNFSKGHALPFHLFPFPLPWLFLLFLLLSSLSPILCSPVFCGKFCKLCVILVKNRENINLTFFIQGERTMSQHFSWCSSQAKTKEHVYSECKTDCN